MRQGVIKDLSVWLDGGRSLPKTCLQKWAKKLLLARGNFLKFWLSPFGKIISMKKTYWSLNLL